MNHASMHILRKKRYVSIVKKVNAIFSIKFAFLHIKMHAPQSCKYFHASN